MKQVCFGILTVLLFFILILVIPPTHLYFDPLIDLHFLVHDYIDDGLKFLGLCVDDCIGLLIKNQETLMLWGLVILGLVCMYILARFFGPFFPEYEPPLELPVKFIYKKGKGGKFVLTEEAIEELSESELEERLQAAFAASDEEQ